MRAWIALLAVVLLAACASAPAPQPADSLFSDHLFTAPSQRISADDVFALDADMRRYLDTEVAGFVRSKGSQRGLFDALHDRERLELEYDAATTRNASQAFAARAGNCLSLVIMTAAFAREMGIPVRYQNVFTDETWSRSGNFYLSIGHVNLTLGRRSTALDRRDEDLTIDFLPPRDIRSMHSWAIGENTIVAMYMNNRAVESLTAGNVNDGYWWAREAIRQDPRFLSAYNTLGVVYQAHANLWEAQQALEYILRQEPGNATAMSNLVTVLSARGQVAAAQELKRRLAQVEPDPPFAYYKRGLAAMQAGDYKLARDMFKKEVDRAAYYHEFQFWLALAYFGLGDTEQARAHMAAAVENSPTRKDHDLYAAKLERLRAYTPVTRR
jgi:tetratricopeptide (TPR) repeat protein